MKDISEAEQIKRLQKQREQCMSDGYMLPTADFDRLHYEDPRVTELKQMDVSGLRKLMIGMFSVFFALQTVQDMYSMADEIICSLYEKRKPAEVVVEETDGITAPGENDAVDGVVNEVGGDVPKDDIAEEEKEEDEK